MSKIILVTGGCGFIGASLVPMLVQRSFSVRVLDNLSRSALSEFPGLDVEVIRGDIRDAAIVEEALTGVNSVIHLAAYGSVIESINDPQTNFEMNVAGTLNMLQQSADVGVQKFVFSSTGGALIGDATPPVNEDSLPKPISPYGAGKLCCEAYCHAFAKSYQLETLSLRFANVYGPFSAHKKGAVTVFARSLMQGAPITIYGDGKASRDFLYVTDLCKGIISGLTSDLPAGSVVHLASEQETRVIELANLMIEVAGLSGHPIDFEEARRGEVLRNFAASDKARELLNFMPDVVLRDGLEKCWDWFCENEPKLLEAAS